MLPESLTSAVAQHDALLKTCQLVLTDHAARPQTDSHPASAVLVFYTHHRPHLAERDLAFFDKARASGWICTEFLTEKYPVCVSHLPISTSD